MALAVSPLARRVCHKAVIRHDVVDEDTLFKAGELPELPAMFFVVSGVLAYTHAVTDVLHEVEPESWLSEAALWTSWCFRGTAAALEDCVLFKLDSTAFQEEVARSIGHDQVRKYAESFVADLNELELNELTDVGMPGEREMQMSLFVEKAFGHSDRLRRS